MLCCFCGGGHCRCQDVGVPKRGCGLKYLHVDGARRSCMLAACAEQVALCCSGGLSGGTGLRPHLWCSPCEARSAKETWNHPCRERSYMATSGRDDTIVVDADGGWACPAGVNYYWRTCKIGAATPVAASLQSKFNANGSPRTNAALIITTFYVGHAVPGVTLHGTKAWSLF
jgi:hypothetical protein